MPTTSSRHTRIKFLATSRSTPFKEQAEAEVQNICERIAVCKRLGMAATVVSENTGLPYTTVNLFFRDAVKEPNYIAVRTLDLYLKSINL